MSREKRICISIRAGTADEVEYSGRMLGLITAEDFSRIVSDKIIAKRVKTGETRALSEVQKRLDMEVSDPANKEFPPLRLVVDVHMKDNKRVYNILLITDVIVDITSFPTDAELGLITQGNDWLYVGEES